MTYLGHQFTKRARQRFEALLMRLKLYMTEPSHQGVRCHIIYVLHDNGRLIKNKRRERNAETIVTKAATNHLA